jgi:hypothetical protein
MAPMSSGSLSVHNRRVLTLGPFQRQAGNAGAPRTRRGCWSGATLPRASGRKKLRRRGVGVAASIAKAARLRSSLRRLPPLQESQWRAARRGAGHPTSWPGGGRYFITVHPWLPESCPIKVPRSRLSTRYPFKAL